MIKGYFVENFEYLIFYKNGDKHAYVTHFSLLLASKDVFYLTQKTFMNINVFKITHILISKQVSVWFGEERVNVCLIVIAKLISGLSHF